MLAGQGAASQRPPSLPTMQAVEESRDWGCGFCDDYYNAFYLFLQKQKIAYPPSVPICKMIGTDITLPPTYFKMDLARFTRRDFPSPPTVRPMQAYARYVHAHSSHVQYHMVCQKRSCCLLPYCHIHPQKKICTHFASILRPPGALDFI
jgi:hypothetical protein